MAVINLPIIHQLFDYSADRTMQKVGMQLTFVTGDLIELVLKLFGAEIVNPQPQRQLLTAMAWVLSDDLFDFCPIGDNGSLMVSL
jgi:hypothetical protein